MPYSPFTVFFGDRRTRDSEPPPEVPDTPFVPSLLTLNLMSKHNYVPANLLHALLPCPFVTDSDSRFPEMKTLGLGRDNAWE